MHFLPLWVTNKTQPTVLTQFQPALLCLPKICVDIHKLDTFLFCISAVKKLKCSALWYHFSFTFIFWLNLVIFQWLCQQQHSITIHCDDVETNNPEAFKTSKWYRCDLSYPIIASYYAVLILWERLLTFLPEASNRENMAKPLLAP